MPSWLVSIAAKCASTLLETVGARDRLGRGCGLARWAGAAKRERERSARIRLVSPSISRRVVASLGRRRHASQVTSSRAKRANRAADDAATLTHLDRLEAESIFILRETVAEAARPVMLYSMGKDSAVMLHLAQKAFFPGPLPFPLLHVDTTWKFRDMYAMRDKVAAEPRHRADRPPEPRGAERRASTRSTMARCTPTCGRPKG